MLRKLVILGICAGGSAAVPVIYQSNPDLARTIVQAASGEAPASGEGIAALSVTGLRKAASPAGRKVVVRSDERGHFVAEFKLNGRRVPAMIDTGATLVAINRSTAKSIGIVLSASDFRYVIDTANGKARAASAMIPSIDIGRIRVENVEGVVLEDGALSQTLVGMSFLKRLDKYQVEDGTLLLAQ